MAPPTPAPLPADPRRQAHRTIGAYVYQVWQSVYAWLTLDGEEMLFLEGAEDFDVVRADCAIATQVKDSARSVTLRSPQIQEAVANAWRLLSAEPNRQVQYRFLTRAAITTESGNPFGKGTAGLKVWRETATRPENVRRLAQFLGKLTSLPQDLRLFLKTKTDQEIVDQFLGRVHWDTANPEAAFVETAVEQKLAVLGENFGIPYSEILPAKNQLFAVVCRVAKQSEHRTLTRADLLREFAASTHVTMPRGEASALRAITRLVGPLLGQLRGNGLSTLSFTQAPTFGTQPPPVPPSILRRAQLLAELEVTLTQSRRLILHGSTGTGKTTLAKLLAGLTATQCKWISMTGTSTTEARHLMLDCARNLTNSSTTPLVVFDDIDFSPASARDLESAIGGILFQLSVCKGSVILTGQKAPPSRLLSGCGIESGSVINVPAFTKDEIVTFLKELGCPADTGLRGWAGLCRIHTRGHPQLVHAYLLSLQERGWPVLNAETLTQPFTAIEEEQTEARQLLSTRSESTRDFLFSLSVIEAPFRRDHAISLSSATSDIVRPGEEFDGLVGPWIEPVGSNYYRVSPLIEKAGESVFDSVRLKATRIAIINTLRSCHPLTTLEAAADFRQSWLARSELHLSAILASLLSAPRRAFTSIAPRIDWFVLEGFEPEHVLWPSRRGLSRMLRWLQARLAVETMPKLLPSIFNSWHFETHGEGAEPHSLDKCMLAVHALTQQGVPLSTARIFEYLHDIDSLEKGEAQFTGMFVEMRRALPRRFVANAENMVEVLTRVLGSRFRTVDAVEELLTTLAECTTELRQSMLKAWRRVPFDLHNLMDGVWLERVEWEIPDWERCLATFARVFQLGGVWNAPQLSVAAIRASAIVIDEYLHDPDRALTLVDEWSAAQKLESPYLDDSRATIHFNRRQDEKALACWISALEVWPEPLEPEDRAPSFAARLAGRAAARIGRWQEAAEHFLDARQRLKTRRAAEYSTGLLSDAGFAFWRAGDNARTMDCLRSALRLAEALPDGKDNLTAFRTRKLLGSVIVWIHNKERGHHPELMSEPQAGMCSELETHPGFRDLPDNELDALWLFLGRLECTFGFDSGLHEEILPKIAQSDSPLLPVFREEYYILRALQRADFATLPNLAWEYTQVITTEWEARPNAPCPWEEDSAHSGGTEFRVTDPCVGAGLFFVAFLNLAARGGPFSATFAQWRDGASKLPGGHRLVNWLNGLEGGLENTEVPTAILNDGVSNWVDVFIVALRVITCRNAAAADIALAQFRVIDSLANTPWLLPSGPALASLFSDGWARAILLPATLSLPNLSIPALKAAIASPSTGVRKAIEVLLAGIDAVGLRMPPAFRLRLKTIHSGELHKLRQ